MAPPEGDFGGAAQFATGVVEVPSGPEIDEAASHCGARIEASECQRVVGPRMFVPGIEGRVVVLFVSPSCHAGIDRKGMSKSLQGKTALIPVMLWFLRATLEEAIDFGGGVP